jgi:hypothetical protein
MARLRKTWIGLPPCIEYRSMMLFPPLMGFARRIRRNIRTMLSKKALTIGFAVEKAGFGFYLAGVFGQVHADGTGCLYHVRSTTVARACTATASIARCGNLV